MLHHMFNLSLETGDAFSVVFDTEKKIVHVLETNPSMEPNIANHFHAVQSGILSRIEGYASSCEIKKWFFYGLQGEIFLWTGEMPEEVSVDHPDLNKHFANKIKLRLFTCKNNRDEG